MFYHISRPVDPVCVTYVGVLDFLDLATTNHGRYLVLFPALDGCRVTGYKPEVIQREHADAEPHGDASRKVEDHEEELAERRLILIVSGHGSCDSTHEWITDNIHDLGTHHEEVV